MKFIVRVLFVIALAIAGIVCLPDGPEKLNYILFRLMPSSFSNTNKTADAYVDSPSDNYVDDEDDDEVSDNDANRGSTTVVSVPSSNIPLPAKLERNRNAIQKTIGENYLDAVLASGKLERWNPKSFPLKVYIEADSGVPSEYIQEVKNAFATWEQETNGFVRFVYTNSPHEANYKCIFSEPLKDRGCDEKGAGAAAYQYFTYKNDGSIEYSIVNFSPYSCSGHKWPKDFFYSTALHEIGHGLGLRGHSTNRSDLMYPIGNSAGRMKISQADMNTLRAVYSIIPDRTDVPFSDEDKKGLITTADYWGEAYQRASLSIRQIEENIKITPNDPGRYIELAQAYKEKGEYNKAIEAYSQALKKVDNSDTACGILFETTSLYMQLGKLESADKCLNRILSYGKHREVTDYYNYVAVKYGKSREYKLAERYFDKALSIVKDENQRIMLYENYRWLGYIQKDKVMFDKYNKLLEGK